MRKKLLSTGYALFISTALLASSANAQENKNEVTLSGVEFSVDTLFHAQVGPGTTQTSLHLINKTNASQQLRVFYLTVNIDDEKNPNVGIEAIVANDKLSGGGRVSNMAQSHSTSTKNYFVGINTDFFVTSGNASNGVSMVGSPVSASIAGGEIYKTAETASNWPTFFIDEKGVPFIGGISFQNGTATCGDQTVKFSVVNNSAANDAISLYTPKFFGTINQASLNGNCAEVLAKAVEGDFIQAGKPLTLEIVSDVTTTGNRDIPDGQYAIVGRGSTIDFVKNLKIGDKVTLTANVTATLETDKTDATSVIPTQLATGNPWILENGVTRESEGDRGDASARHPRSSLGYNEDKTEMIMMVIDGRSPISSGVHTKELADMMCYAGASDAINVDGGGSSTLYTEALGLRNNCSDGSERAVASGMFAVANVPNDNTIAEIKFREWAMVCPKYGIYTPVFYGYNQYGVLIDTDVQGVTLSCEPELGEITNEGKTFYATGEGLHALKASYNDLSTSIAVTVEESDDVSFRLQNILIDNKREYPMEVNAQVSENIMPINPEALSWTSANSDIVEIGESTGIIKGAANGTTTITGTIGNFIGTAKVTVEIPESTYMPVYHVFPKEWILKQLGGTDLTIEEIENGFKLKYTGNGSSRGAYISLDNSTKIWSLPESFRIRINPGNAIVKGISMTASNALGKVVSPWVITEEELPTNTESILIAHLSDWCDTEDIGIYPITINSFRLNMGASAKDEAFEIQVPAFEACYNSNYGSVSSIESDGNTATIFPNPVNSGETVTINVDGEANVSVYSISGATIFSTECKSNINIPTDGMNGMYIIKVNYDDNTQTAKLIVK